MNILMSGSRQGDPWSSPEGELELEDQVKEPKMYKVLLLNDDYSPMDFVILVLQKFFGKNEEQATQIMWDVHKKGSGVCGVYTKEVAETKVFHVNQFSKLNQYPLKAIFEEES